MMKTVFTTGEAAEVCKVSQQTIIRCFDSGRLRGFRVPGSRFRRIPREALLQFMKDNGIPPDSLDNGKTKILVVDDDPEIVELFVDVLERDGRFEVKTASTGYDAGMITQEFNPDLLILDYMLPDINGNVDSSAKEVTDLIATDPALTARILHLVHRSDLGVRGEVSSIERAVILLGFDAVRSAVLAVSVFNTFQHTDPKHPGLFTRE